MNSKECVIEIIDEENECLWDRQFDSKKEAKAFVKENLKSRHYLDDRGESPYVADNAKSIRLMIEDECEEEWFVDYSKEKSRYVACSGAYQYE
jgi:hypothetical protein